VAAVPPHGATTRSASFAGEKNREHQGSDHDAIAAGRDVRPVRPNPYPATAAVFVLRPALNRAAAQALQVPVAELSTAGIGRFGVAVTLAPAGALLVPVATVALAVFKPWGLTASGAADQSQRPVPG
jgi:hypothetical protein